MPADFDIDSHVKTWSGFVKLLGFSVAGVVVLLLILMATFLI